MHVAPSVASGQESSLSPMNRLKKPTCECNLRGGACLAQSMTAPMGMHAEVNRIRKAENLERYA